MNGTTTYAYDGADARVGKTGSGGSRTYRRDGVGVTDPVLSDGVSTMVPGISERSNAVTRFSHLDRLGTNARTTDASGNVVDSRNYDAFGLPVSASGPNVGTSEAGFASGFGYQEDGESGLKLLGHRYYDSATGRFITRDPAQAGLNWYGYCGNGPTKNIDPDGLKLRISDDYTPEERQEVEEYLDKMKNADPITRQMLDDLINDDIDHVIAPTRSDPVYGNNRVRLPHTDRASDGKKTVTWFDPDKMVRSRGKGPHGEDLTSMPSVILDHELGHAYGKVDPPDHHGNRSPRPGDNVWDVENRYRKWYHLPLRQKY